VTVQLIGARCELGRCFARSPIPAGVRIHIVGQQANTLLHDGHAWKNFDRLLAAGVRRATRGGARFLVHASFAFVAGGPKQDPLRAIAEAIVEAERRILAGPVPACVVRLGYLYGPQSRDLLAYRTAFRIGRPYWAGPRGALQYHLHQDDAVAALLAAARQRPAGRILYATDGHAASFLQFMDDFARRVGRRHPLHVPRLAAGLMRAIVRKEHMQQAALVMPARVPGPRVPGFRPRFADYRDGLDQVLATWKDEGR
jgi:nucleoside-diphosphate-sugar epimerase